MGGGDEGELGPPGARLMPGDLAGSRRGFLLVAAAFTTVMVGGLLPSPLYVIYQSRLHFSTGILTVVFAVYAGGVLGALVLWGGLSDQVGRRVMMAAALVVAAASSAAFIAAQGLALLLVGRLLSGVSIGLALATASAYLAELDRSRASRVATAASTGGLGLGSLIAGLVAQWVPQPTVVAFAVLLALVVVAGLGLMRAPETVPSRPSARPGGPGSAGLLRPQLPALPSGRAWAFAPAALAAFSGFATFGLFASLAPSFLRHRLHDPSHAVAGAVVMAVFGAAAIVQSGVGEGGGPALIRWGAVLLPAGLGLVVAAVGISSVGALVGGAAIGGVAVGLLFSGGLSMANALSPPEQRAGVLASFYIAAYLGVGLPPIGAGIALDHVGTLPTTAAYAGVMSALAGLAALGMRRGRGRGGPLLVRQGDARKRPPVRAASWSGTTCA